MVTISDDAAILSAAGVLIGAIFVLFQLRHMEMHRNVEISMKLFEWAESDRLRKAFRWIENEFQFVDFEKALKEMSPEVADYPKQVAAFFEQVGFLAGKKFVDLDVIADSLGPEIVSNWKKLEPWILSLRKEKGDETFGEHFQALYEKIVGNMRRRCG